VYFCGRDQRISYWSPGAERITGFSADEVRGSSCADGILTHVDQAGTDLCKEGCPLSATLTDGEPREAQVYLHHKRGHRVPVLVRTSPIYDDKGEIDGAVETFTDNSRLLEALEKVEQLSMEAETDPLTGLGNRRSMESRLDACVGERRRLGTSVGVLFVDIDHFKRVNDDFGHEVGDQVLKMVGETMRHNLRTSDWLARWGGEEFLVLLQRVDERTFPMLVEKLRMLVANSYLNMPDGSELRVTVSMGGTLLRPGDTRRTVVARADRLLYQSKAGGRDRLTWSK
jgi:diguanylate cyclase (GGDEF)-like protein/PAS domain S-box-containing protein